MALARDLLRFWRRSWRRWRCAISVSSPWHRTMFPKQKRFPDPGRTQTKQPCGIPEQNQWSEQNHRTKTNLRTFENEQPPNIEQNKGRTKQKTLFTAMRGWRVAPRIAPRRKKNAGKRTRRWGSLCTGVVLLSTACPAEPVLKAAPRFEPPPDSEMQ